MAIPIETLVVKISADIGDLKNQMAASQKAVAQNVSKTQSELRKSVVAWAKWAAAAIGAWKAVGSIIRQLSIVDELAKTSRALGITIESLAAYQFAGKLAGVEARNLSVALRFMTKSLGDASQGIGEARIALKTLNVDLHTLLAMSPDQQFEFLADRISKLGTHAERASVTMKIFGESGIKMLNMIQGGRRAFEEARNATRAYGTAISDIDAQQIENINDTVTEMKEAWAGLARSILIELAPAIVKAIHFIVDAIDGLRLGWHGARFATAEFAIAVRKILGGVVIFVVDQINTMLTAVNAAIHTLNQLPDVVKATAGIGGLGQIKTFGLFDLKSIRANFDRSMSAYRIVSNDAQMQVHKIRDAMIDRHRRWAKSAARMAQQINDALREEARKEFLSGLGADLGAAIPTGEGGADPLSTRVHQTVEMVRSEQALRAEVLDEGMTDEMTRLQEAHAEKLSMIQAFEDQYTESTVLAENLRAEVIAQHEKQVSDLIEKERAARIDGTLSAANTAIGSFRLITGAAEEGSRQQFEANKALGIAEASVNTAAAITAIWREHAGSPWLIGGLTALALAAGAAQIAKIQSTQFGGGSGTPAPAATGGAGAAAESGAATGGGGGGGGPARAQDVNVTIVGDVFSGGAIRGLIERINEEQEDGTTLRLRTT